MSRLDIHTLRRYSVARSLGRPAPIEDTIRRMGFVQADPIRSPARAQDLTLRHRVPSYRAGDLERRYRTLAVDEDFFINYGFLPRELSATMHPRGRLGAWPAPGKRVGDAVLAFVARHGEVHPRDVDRHFAKGAVRNYWGGSSSATTHALDHLHYRGLLRVADREGGIRRYALRPAQPPVTSAEDRRARVDRLVEVLVALYAPVPGPTLAWLMNRLRLAVPQWHAHVPTARQRATQRTEHARVEGVDWYWPAGERPDDWSTRVDERVRLLAPFDPIVWDRRRFAMFWDWPYKFEAYTPAPSRRFGYYALPLLWRDRVVGWSNLSVEDGTLRATTGFATGRPPRDRGFRAALEAELDSVRSFLGLEAPPGARGARPGG